MWQKSQKHLVLLFLSFQHYFAETFARFKHNANFFQCSAHNNGKNQSFFFNTVKFTLIVSRASNVQRFSIMVKNPYILRIQF